MIASLCRFLLNMSTPLGGNATEILAYVPLINQEINKKGPLPLILTTVSNNSIESVVVHD